MTATAAGRHTAEERREEIVEAAFAEFAAGGLHGTSTDVIARRAGISQPYLFRLFGTKKELFLAAVERCHLETLKVFQEAAEGVERERVLEAMGRAYVEMLADRQKLRMQMQAQAACDDPEVCAAVRRNFGRLVEYIEQVSGADPKRVRDFVARGMLFNVLASMDLLECQEPWAERLTGACKE